MDVCLLLGSDYTCMDVFAGSYAIVCVSARELSLIKERKKGEIL